MFGLGLWSLWSLPGLAPWLPLCSLPLSPKISWTGRLTEREELAPGLVRGGHDRSRLSRSSPGNDPVDTGPAPTCGFPGGSDWLALVRLCGESPGRDGERGEGSGGTDGRVRLVGDSGVVERVASLAGGTVERGGMLSGG